MTINVGLVGLPNVGKSTLFNALTGGNSPVGNFPFTTKGAHVGSVSLEHPRLHYLSQVFESPKTTPARLDIVDIAGLVKGAARGEGLGNQFLSHIREVDAVIHVVRAFADPSVSQSTQDDELEIIQVELMMSDLQMLQRRCERLGTAVKARDKQALSELERIQVLTDLLERGKRADEHPQLAEQQCKITPLLTSKPALIAANTDGSQEASERITDLQKRYPDTTVVPINAKIAYELLDMEAEERTEFIAEIPDATTDPLVTATANLVNLITFFTGNDNETRAWLIERGSTAVQAGGCIHSDMQDGFIACDVIRTDSLIEIGSWGEAKSRGQIRTEGSTYIVQDGDVLLFKFSPPRKKR